MGKSKSKKSQPKRYPTPTDKYLIVTDPWGGVPKEPNFFNNVTAWFEIMFKPKYPGARPSAIFYQWTNKNIIVEIPDHIDVEPYLGTHYWSLFLAPQYSQKVGTRASYIYEFETQFFPIPAAQGGWKPGYAQYTKIRPDFEVKDPYPPPFPAPNSPLPFAKKLPPGKVGQVQPLPALPPLPELDFGPNNNNEKAPSQQDDSGESTEKTRTEKEGVDNHRVSDPRKRKTSQPRDTAQTQTIETKPQNDIPVPKPIPLPLPPSPTPPPTLLSPRKRKKMDPYEEDEAAMNLLRQSVPTTAVVKQELLVDEDTILRSDKEYEPSRELLDAFSTLQQLPNPSSSSGPPIPTPTPAGDVDDNDDLPDFVDDDEEGYDDQMKIKPEPYDDDDDTYQPSTEWAQAFSSLGDDNDGYKPSEDLMSALASLPQGMVDLEGGSTSPTTAGVNLGAGGSRGGRRKGVKLEPVEDDRDVLLATRSKQITTTANVGGMGRRVIKRELSDEYASTKRVKLEH